MPLVPAVLFQVFLWWSLALAVAVVLASCTSWFKLSATSEVLLTIATLCVCGALLQTHSPFTRFEEWVGSIRDMFVKKKPSLRYDLLLVRLMPGLLLMGPVIALHAVKRRSAAMLTGLLWSAAVGSLFYAFVVQPNVRLALKDGPPEFPPGQVLITKHVEILRAVLILATGILAAVYTTRRRFTPRRFLLACVAGSLGVHMILYAFFPWWDWRSLLTVALSGCFVGLAASMPAQRRALAHYLSLHWEAEPPVSSGRFTRLLRGAIVGALGVVMVLLVVLNRMEAEVVHLEDVGPPEDRSLRVGRNAYEVLYPHIGRQPLASIFDGRLSKAVPRDKSPYIRGYEWSKQTDSRLVGLVNGGRLSEVPNIFFGSLSRKRESQLFTDLVRQEIVAEEEHYKPLIEAMAASKEMSTLSPYLNGRYTFPRLLWLREVSRVLSRQNTIALYDGNWSRALDRCELMLSSGCQLRDGNLVIHMTGVSTRGLATASLYDFRNKCQDDPEALAAAARLMEEYGTRARPAWPIENLAHYQNEYRPVVVFFDVWGKPSLFKRARMIFLRNIAQYDQVEIAIALDRYRLDCGVYPETLDELAGVYLNKLPVSPFDGQRYVYRPLGDSFDLKIPECDLPEKEIVVGFSFPPEEDEER